MQHTKHSTHSILQKEAIGFSLILLLSWVTEIVGIPHLLYGEPFAFNWNRAVLRSIVIIGVWFWVHVATKRVLKRLRYLEEYLLICSWCRKVGHEGEWLTMEQYFGSTLSTETSHGICPECAVRLRPFVSPETPGANPPDNSPLPPSP